MAFNSADINPYSAAAQNLDPSAPTSHAVLLEACHQMALGLRVAVPARVVKVISNQRVSLQPLYKARYVGEVAKDLPIIPEAHVTVPLGQAWGIKLPLAVGDLGIALLADRSLDAWAASDGTRPLDPRDGRYHDLTDAFFLPGAVPTAHETSDTTADLVLRNGNAQLRIAPSGGFQLTNGTNELVALTKALASQVQTLTSAVASLSVIGGAVSPPQVAKLTAQAGEVEAIAAGIATLVGPS
jgi:hypothetical protein